MNIYIYTFVGLCNSTLVCVSVFVFVLFCLFIYFISSYFFYCGMLGPWGGMGIGKCTVGTSKLGDK